MALRAFAARSQLAALRGSTSRTTTTSTCCSRASACARRDTPGRDHADRGAAPPDAGRVRRAPRAHVPRRAGLHVRPRRRRDAARRAGRRGLRRVGGARHRVARRGRRPAGRPAPSSRIENYVGFPNGISGEELADARRDPGPAARRAAQRAVRGRRPARRGRLPRASCSADGSEIPCRGGDRRVGRALPAPRGRRPRAVRGRRRVLRRDRPRGAHLHRAAT